MDTSWNKLQQKAVDITVKIFAVLACIYDGKTQKSDHKSKFKQFGRFYKSKTKQQDGLRVYAAAKIAVQHKNLLSYSVLL